MSRRIWTREEFILVLNLYTKIPYGQFHARNKEIIKLATLIDRSPGAVAYKLVHFSGLDQFHKNRGIKGLANPGQNAINIYNEFISNWNEMIFESELLLAKRENKLIDELHPPRLIKIDADILLGKIGLTKQALTKIRVNQSIFRKVIIANYFNKCAVCNLDVPDLLIAGHILKWSENFTERLNPANGICLCNIHDKAYECGYLGIDPNYKIVISNRLNKIKDTQTSEAYFVRFQNKTINLPDKFCPEPEYLKTHHDKIFLN